MRKFGKQTVLLLAVLFVAAAGVAWAESAPTAGAVTISYDLHRIPTVASNQLAVWIESADGAFVKTLYVSRFTGQGGYERRPECLPLWRKAAGIDGPPGADVDAVTSATQQPGRQSLAWDCTDAAGQPVAPGKYVYKLEGTLFWAKEVLWTGEITVGGTASSSRAEASYLPPAARDGEPLVVNVTASFSPR